MASVYEKLNKLFDIIRCQCEIYKCSGGEACCDKQLCSGYHVRCECSAEFKIPIQEVSFVKDQREKIGIRGGQMVMERLDMKDVKKNIKQLEEDERATKKDEQRKRASLRIE